MLKQEIIEKITKYFKLTHFEAEKIYDNIFQEIIEGVKKDNITDVSNLGEFIIKYHDKSTGGHNKTVEFLPAMAIEEEISESSEIPETDQTKVSKPEIVEPAKSEQGEVKHEVKENPELESISYEDKKEEISKVKPEMPELKEDISVPKFEALGVTDENLSVEDEIRRKREQIINKLNPQHEEEYHKLLHVTGKPLNVPKPIVLDKSFETSKEEHHENLEQAKEEIKEIKEDTESSDTKTEEQVKIENEKHAVDELSTKSFSDYFSEVKNEQKSESPTTPYVPPVKPVIPPAAVDLHNEIINDEPPKAPVSYQPEIQKPLPEVTVGNGYSEDSENRANDNSYYIWYKDSEPNAVDTQTMSYEYELLYQATKEAEYKSKLRIYVTTFILFFSIVLLLLIFSPVIYKYFFTPQEIPSEEVQPPAESLEEVGPPPNNKADLNKLDETGKQTTEPVTSNEQKISQTEQKPSTNDPNSTANVNIPGVLKVEGGWKDEKLGVTYVQLENGKFTIQESSWNNEEKANSRVNTINSYNITGMKGNVAKVDLGAKGTWYRVRAGEFGSVEEAKSKAEELRKK